MSISSNIDNITKIHDFEIKKICIEYADTNKTSELYYVWFKFITNHSFIFWKWSKEHYKPIDNSDIYCSLNVDDDLKQYYIKKCIWLNWHGSTTDNKYIIAKTFMFFRTKADATAYANKVCKYCKKYIELGGYSKTYSEE